MGEKDIRTLLSDARDKAWSDQTLVQRSIDLARELGAPTLSRLNGEERTFLSALSRLVADDRSRHFAEQLCELVFSESENAAERMRGLLDEMGGIPTFFSSMARLRIKAAAMASRGMQGAALGELRRVFRATFGEPVLPEHVGKITRRADAMAKEGIRLALSPQEPEVYGETAAKEYAEALAAILVEQPRAGIVVEAVRLCPGLSICSPNHSAKQFAARLRRLISASLLAGGSRPIVVETACSDTLPIIVEGLKQALDSPECDTADIALELPGYLKTSASILRELVDWARRRAERGAAPLKVLLVKGSHLEAEKRCASTYGTESQLCTSKAETDTCFARLLNAAMNSPAKVITPVVGTHELIHLCYAALRWARSGREGLPPVCLLYGVGNHIARQFARMGASVTLRAPLVQEGSKGSSFERYLMSLVSEFSRPGGFLEGGYAADATGASALSDKARPLMAANSTRDDADARDAGGVRGFVPGHLGALMERPYVDAFYEAAAAEKERSQSNLPLLIGGQPYESPLTFIHRSLTVPGLVDYRFASADYRGVDMALQHAQRVASSPKPVESERVASLLKAARELRRRSTEFAALLVRDAGFTLQDAQIEIRDAIDACRFYASDSLHEGFADGTAPQPLGVTLVAVGTAHPLAEALAGIAAAWVGGNTIVYKPAAYSTLVGSRLTELLLSAGVELLCLPCMDNEICTRLMTDPRVDALVCSADAGFARAFSARSPMCSPLVSPAGGACVYMAESCDWRGALRDIVSAGTRRSGGSPACPQCVLVHAHVYDDPAFMAALQDAVSSLSAKPTWLEGADLGPVASPLSEAERHLLRMDTPAKGEIWLHSPHEEEMDSLIWQPAIAGNIAPDGEMLRYGRRLPILKLRRVESAEEAVAMVRCLSGNGKLALYTHEDQEIAAFKDMPGCRWLAVNCMPAGRVGVVPVPTGRAMLGGARAPMAGGRNYAPALCRWQELNRPSMRSARRNLRFDPKGILPSASNAEETMRLSAAADSVSYWWEHEFSEPQPLPTGAGLRASVSYHPLRICLRIEKAMSDADVAIALMAAMQAGSHVQLSVAALRPWLTLFAEQYGITLLVQNRAEFGESFPELASAGYVVRDPAALDDTIALAASHALPLTADPILANGRLELLYYLEERVTIEPGV